MKVKLLLKRIRFKTRNKWNKNPETAILMINTKCNLKCSFCDLYKDNKEMKFDKIKYILDELKKLKIKYLAITGGEPLFHKDISKIINYAYKLGYSISLATNGLLIKNNLNTLNKVNFISISLDGIKETHNKLRNADIYNKVVDGIKSLKKLKKNKKRRIEINFVVTNKNIKDLKKVYLLSKRLNTLFNFWPVNGHKELALKNKDNINQYLKFLKFLKKKKFPKDLEYYYNTLHYLNNKIKVRCLGLKTQFAIDVNGNILPCCVWNKNLVLGNIFKKDIKKVWYSRKAEKIRKNISNFKCNEDCYNVSFLNEYKELTNKPYLKFKS